MNTVGRVFKLLLLIPAHYDRIPKFSHAYLNRTMAMQMKAEQMKARAQEKLANKLAEARRVAEEKRASAEAMLNEGAARTSEKADYIRRTGHLPSSFFSFRIPSLCG
jgi:hypothetical protein